MHTIELDFSKIEKLWLMHTNEHDRGVDDASCAYDFYDIRTKPSCAVTEPNFVCCSVDAEPPTYSASEWGTLLKTRNIFLLVLGKKGEKKL